MNEKEKILRELYNESLDYMCWYPVPATCISKFTKVSLYKTKKILHNLQDEGIVKFKRGYVSDRFSYEGELEEEGFFYCGWELTENGKDNDLYKKLKKEYDEEMDKMGRDFNDFCQKLNCEVK